MEIKQLNELDFWKSLYKENYIDFRFKDGQNKMKFFKDLPNRDGIGLDLGNGLISVFNGLKNNIVAIDPLNDEYGNICEIPCSENITYLAADGECIPFPDGYFDYVFCCNVIDHTPNPDKMAAEIKRVLRKGGTLYFEVNFDDFLSPCHYALWDKEMVEKYFGDLKQKFCFLERNSKDKQYLYHAIYEN